MAAPSPGLQRQRSRSPALVNLLQAAETMACDFSADAGVRLAPFVAGALQEQQQAARRSATPPSEALTDSPPESLENSPVGGDLHSLMGSLGWDPRTETFAVPLNPRDLSTRLKASLLTDLTLVGEGSYSFVYRAHNRLDGTNVTLKKLRLDDNQTEEGLPATAVREMSLLRELSDCPNIVRLLDVLYEKGRAFLIMEHLDVDLHQYLQANPVPRNPTFIKSTLYQILRGLEAAHARRVIHRDLKPQNILLDNTTGDIKIADFGLSRTFFPAGCGRRTMTKTVVTLLYRAPEVLLGCRQYSETVDMWSAGCVLAEIALGAPLFAGDSEIGQLFQVFQLLGTPDDAVWPGVTDLPDWQPLFPRWQVAEDTLAQRMQGSLCPQGLDLLDKLLKLDPEKRLNASQALAHPYFDDCRDA